MSNNSSKKYSNKFYKENNYSWYKQDQDGKWHCVVCRRAKLKSAYANGHDQPAKTTSHQRHSISNQHNAAVEKTVVPSVCFIAVPVVDMPEITAVKQHININVCDKCILCTFSFKRIEVTPSGQTINHDKYFDRKLKLTRERLKDITYIVPDIKKNVASIAQGVCAKCYKKVQTIIRKEKEIKKDKKAMIDLYRQVNVASITVHSTSGKSTEKVVLPKRVVLEETKSKTETEPSLAVQPMESTDVNQNEGRVMVNVESTVAECEPYAFELPVDGQAVSDTIKEEPTDMEHLLAFDTYTNAIHLDGQATSDDVKKEPLDTDHTFASNTVSNNILLHGQEISNQNMDTPAAATHALAPGNASDIPSRERNLPEPQIKVEPNTNSYTFDIETDSPNHQVTIETKAMKNELAVENGSDVPDHHHEVMSDLCRTLDEQNVDRRAIKNRERKDDHVCSSCGKKFKRKATLVEHEKFVHHGNKGTYHCCGQWFRKPSYFKRHLCSVHGREKIYSCENCGKSFAIKADLNRHLRHKSGMLSNKCNHCDQVFESKQRLKDHEGIHTGAPPSHQCPTCSKLFRFKSDVARHSKIHMVDN